VLLSVRVLRKAVLIALVGTSVPALGSPYSVVPGGQDPDDAGAEEAQKSVDVYGEVDYAYELSSSTLLREQSGPGSDPGAALPLVRDLEFKQFRHVLTPRLQVGVFRDTFIYAALPIVIAQAREHELTAGLDRSDSSSVRDGILPEQGFDARDPSTPTTGPLMFRGPGRRGLDQIHLGLGVAPMNQAKDSTKPTWKLGAEVRLAIGKVMHFDPTAPNENRGVSQGVQELRLWTSFARKLDWVEPWIEVFWLKPLTAREGSLFDDPGFGATSVLKSQQAGVAFGLELYAIEQPENQTRISFDVGTKVNAHFEGREYTEMWEIFAAAGESRGMGPLILDRDPERAGTQPMSHPGISNIENYLETSGRFALRAQLGPHVRFAVLADLIWKTDHVITFADAGVDYPTCGSGESPCEDTANELVNPGTDEVNPLHAPLIDLVGHRYHSVDNFDIAIGVQGQVLF
jgi:hypothetical protein